MKFENIKILGTIHKLHNENKNYTIAHIKKEIIKFSPDIIAVEIRNEDINNENDYLVNYYPLEMIEIKKEFEKKIPIIGFDWRGEEIKNKPIEKWSPFKNFKNKNIEKLIGKRLEIMNTFYKNCDIYECQDKLKLQELSLIEENINNLLVKFGYKNLVDYKKNRELIMGSNLSKINRDNKDKKILILTGITHVLFLNNYFGKKCL